MIQDEVIINIDFEDRAGLGYEVFEVCEKNKIDKISMEVIPASGMFIKMRTARSEQLCFIEELKQIKGVNHVAIIRQMPYEFREHKLSTILNAINEGVVALDSNGNIQHINRLACKIFNCEQDDVLGKAANTLFEKDSPIISTLNSGQPSRLIERKVKRGDSMIRIIMNSDPIKDSDNHIIGAVATIKDFKEIEALVSKVDFKQPFNTVDDIIYQSSKMKQLIDVAKTVSYGDSTVMLRGESGTGKELFARAIHSESHRKHGPFIAINCAALPEALLESELFGYEGGAFTDAAKEGKKGIFEQANRGTIFLDEIGEIPHSVQIRLLRVIQEGAIRRVGGSKEINVNVRIVTATHRNLEEMIKNGSFREDLYYRLNVIPLIIPPLRNRVEDIPLLSKHLLRKLAKKLNKPEVWLTPDSIQFLKSRDWPGNVRELENVLERVMNMVNRQELNLQDFYDWTDHPNTVVASHKPVNHHQIMIDIPDASQHSSLKSIVHKVEREILIRVLRKHNSSRKAGRMLNVSNTTILNKIKQLKITQAEINESDN